MSVIAMRRIRLAPQAVAPAADTGPLAVADLRAYTAPEGYTVLRLETRSGVIGWGECAALTAGEVSLVRQAILREPATAYERLRTKLAGMPAAEAGVTMALLDIIGKYAKAPLYQVLGGPTRNKVRAMASTDSASVRAAHAAGHRAFLVPAKLPQWRNSGQGWVQAVRKELDILKASAPDSDFALDAGGSLTPGDAASIAAELERFRLLWLDEPCSERNLATLRKIAGETVTPLGLGRHVHRAGDFQDMLREEVIDVLRPSLARNGLAQIRRMAALAETYYVAIAPYHMGGPIATAAALHLAASLPNFFIQQIPYRRQRLVTPDVESVKDGYLTLPTGAGLGITVNESGLERMQA
ncbi:MAG: enolase C-terminal domain-like protein [Bryobacteraceae bacterium]